MGIWQYTKVPHNIVLLTDFSVGERRFQVEPIARYTQTFNVGAPEHVKRSEYTTHARVRQNHHHQFFVF